MHELAVRAAEKLKAIVRPVRRSIERAKYVGSVILDEQAGNDYLASLVGRPAAVGRFGASELAAVIHYLRHKDEHHYCEHWGRHATMLYRNAGVYPRDPAVFSSFCQVYLDALRELDVLGVWMRPGEDSIRRRYAARAQLMELRALEPYYHERPWTARLEGTRVLIISPFVDSIEAQYGRRARVWREKPQVLPEFKIRSLRVPMSAALVPPVFDDWFAGLHSMRREMEREPFDVAFVGAGAWSLPLVAHARKLGAMGVHLGGATQILFGIRGRRWETNQEVSRYFNDAWVRPSASETPGTARQIENGCYW